MLSTIDFLSKGRLTLGIGVGWCREEFEAIGAAPFDDRGAVTDEWMDACKVLWTEDNPRFSGKYVTFDDVVFAPKPVQQPIPIWVGGESGPALRRTATLRQWLVPGGDQPEIPHEQHHPASAPVLARFRGYCEKAGRDPAEISVAFRVLGGPGAKPRGTIDTEGEMFTGDAADWAGDIKALRDLGITAVDVRLFERHGRSFAGGDAPLPRRRA